MKQKIRLLVAMAAALIAILATGNARAEMPDNTFGTVGTAADGSYLVEVGRGVSVARIVEFYDKVYREATKNDHEPNGEPLTWGVIHAENEGRVIPYCSRPKNGPKWLPTRSTMVWNECDENDRSIILIAGPSGRIKVPVKSVESFAQMQARLAELDAFVKSLGCKRSDVACLKGKIATGKPSEGVPQAKPATAESPDANNDADEHPDAGATNLNANSNDNGEKPTSQDGGKQPGGGKSPSSGLKLSDAGILAGFTFLLGFAVSQALKKRSTNNKKKLNPREVETQKSLKPPSAKKLGIVVPDSPWVAAPTNGNGAHAAALPIAPPMVVATGSASGNGMLQTVSEEPQELLPELMQTTPNSPERYKAISKLNGKGNGNGANGNSLPIAPEPSPVVEDLHAQCVHDLEEAECRRVADLSRLRNKAIEEIAKRDTALVTEQRANAATRIKLTDARTQIETIKVNAKSLGEELERTKGRLNAAELQIVALKSDGDKLTSIRETFGNADSVQSNIYLHTNLAAVVESDRSTMHRGEGQGGKDEASFRALINELEMAKAAFIRSIGIATNRDDGAVALLFSALFHPVEEKPRSDVPASANSRYEESGPLRLPPGVAQPPLPAIEGSASDEPPRDVAGEAYLRRHTNPNADAAVVRRIDTEPLRFGVPNAVVSEDETTPVPPLSAPMGEFPGAQSLLAASSDKDDPAAPARVSKVPTLVPPPPPTVRTPTTS